MNKQRIYASLLTFGAAILLFRVIRMMFFEDAFQILATWVQWLLIAEALVDLLCLISSIRWFITGGSEKAGVALKSGAAATLIHAVRVLIYVLGRTGPWINFDIKTEFRNHYTFEWFWVYFAGILSALGVVGVVIITFIIKRKKRQLSTPDYPHKCCKTEKSANHQTC